MTKGVLAAGLALVCLLIGGVYFMSKRISPTVQPKPSEPSVSGGSARDGTELPGKGGKPVNVSPKSDPSATGAAEPPENDAVTEAFKRDLELALQYPKSNTEATITAVARIGEKYPANLLRAHKEEVRKIGWTQPGDSTFYLMLLKAGTTQEERNLLREKHNVPSFWLAKYGSDADVDDFFGQVKKEVEKAQKQPGSDGILRQEYLDRVVELGLDNEKVAAFFVECLNSPKFLPTRNEGGEISLARLALDSYIVSQMDRSAASRARSKAWAQGEDGMRAAEKYLQEKHGWQVKLRVPYLLKRGTPAKMPGPPVE